MGRIPCQNLRGDFMALEGKRINELTEVSKVDTSSKLAIDTGGEEALSITLKNLIDSSGVGSVDIATPEKAGIVKPDGTTISVSSDGTISATVSGDNVATKAELQAVDSSKADTALSNVLANIDYVVESQVNTDGSWYRKYKSGWVEQGGQTPTVAGGATTTVTLLKPYNNAVYNVVVQPVGAYTGAGEANNVIPTRTTTNFIIACGQIAAQAFSWRTEGQGAN